jgi:hypothetical protein
MPVLDRGVVGVGVDGDDNGGGTHQALQPWRDENVTPMPILRQLGDRSHVVGGGPIQVWTTLQYPAWDARGGPEEGGA